MEYQRKPAFVFFSSPHHDGFTSKALNIFMKNAEGYKFNIIDCYKRETHPCIDCGYCKKKPKCIFNDMDDIDNCLREADLLIFASPVYNFSFPAPFKLMLDRMQRYFCARFFLGMKSPIFKEKNAILIATCGSDDDYGVNVMIMQLKKFFTIVNCRLLGTIILKDTDNLVITDIEDKIEKNVIKVINKLKN